MSLELDAENFLWNDGGRAASGYVGYVGDCVPRAIAIASGRAYREVYQEIFERAQATPRQGVANSVSDSYLRERGWQSQVLPKPIPFDLSQLPRGVVIARLKHAWRNISGHMSCVIDHVVHDTWFPLENEYQLCEYWIHPAHPEGATAVTLAPRRGVSSAEELSQAEFERVLKRLKALDRTARNAASTEGERRNALRALQNLMLAHNLSQEELRDDSENRECSWGRIVCPVNGTRLCRWEQSLSSYICREVFNTVQFYVNTHHRRSFVIFYGPIADVRMAVQLFRELLLTIAYEAKRQFGGYARGSGASYCEGYVEGLPREIDSVDPTSSTQRHNRAVIQTRLIALRDAAREWLDSECGVQLTMVTRTGRSQHDPLAARTGYQDGSRQSIDKPGRVKRLGFH